jgi:hypothetical protein
LSSSLSVSTESVRRIDDVRWLNQPLVGGGLIMVEGDSLTAGAASTSFRSTFNKIARAAFGDGGPGFQPLNNTVANFYGVTFNKSSGLSYIDLADGIYGDRMFAGLYALSADGSQYVNWTPASAWDTARL